MPNLQVFDRINNINGPKLRSMPYNQYFGEMRLTDEEKRERIALAERLEDVMMFLFYLIISQDVYRTMSGEEIKRTFKQRLTNVIGTQVEISPDIEAQIDEFADNTTDTTLEHLPILLSLYSDEGDKSEEKEKKKKSEQFYLSDDRARLLAEEQSNSIYQYSDYEKALRLGYKGKMWVTMRDPFVRRTHQRVDGKIIPIRELFMVGESFMRFPRDMKYGASLKEISGCRCTIKFIK